MAPYVHPDERNSGIAVSPGQLAWKLACLVEDYTQLHGKKFQTFAEILGALDSVRTEYHRVVVGPYEQAKLEAHGPVFS